MASSTLIEMASVNSSDHTRSSQRPVALATSKQTKKSRRLSKNFAGKIEEVKERHCEKGKPLTRIIHEAELR
jgi:hypothetical protein